MIRSLLTCTALVVGATATSAHGQSLTATPFAAGAGLDGYTISIDPGSLNFDTIDLNFSGDLNQLGNLGEGVFKPVSELGNTADTAFNGDLLGFTVLPADPDGTGTFGGPLDAGTETATELSASIANLGGTISQFGSIDYADIVTPTGALFSYQINFASSGNQVGQLAGVIPEPASLALVGLGGLAMAARRRRA